MRQVHRAAKVNLVIWPEVTLFFRAQHIPDSHLTGQLSGLRIWPGECSTEEEVSL